MSNLEQRMLEAIKDDKWHSDSDVRSARTCAEIALQEIRRAFKNGKNYQFNQDICTLTGYKNNYPDTEEYLLEQNLIEKK